MSTNEPQHIIVFDFDGVIADSFDIAYDIKHIEYPTLTREAYAALFNANIGEAAITEPRITEVDFMAEFGERFSSLDIDSSIPPIIQQLGSIFPLFIISSTVNSIIAEFLERHGLLQCFEKIYGWDIAHSKVKKFAMLFDEYNYSPTHTTFVTDTAGDVAEAREAEVNNIVGILGGYQTKEALQAGKPDAIVHNMAEFLTHIQQ